MSRCWRSFCCGRRDCSASGCGAGSEHAGGARSRAPSLGGTFAGVNLPLLLGAHGARRLRRRGQPLRPALPQLVCIYAIMVIGFQFIFGYVGAVSLAQSCFFGLGAYVTACWRAIRARPSLRFPLSILAAVVLAVLIAIPVLKLEDHYFSLATLSVSLLVELVAIKWEIGDRRDQRPFRHPADRSARLPITTRFSTSCCSSGSWLVSRPRRVPIRPRPLRAAPSISCARASPVPPRSASTSRACGSPPSS